MVIGPLALGLLLSQPDATATQHPGAASTAPATTAPASTAPASMAPASMAAVASNVSPKRKLLEERFDKIVDHEMAELIRSYRAICSARPPVKSAGYDNHTAANQGLFTDSGSLAITDRLATAVNLSAPDGFAAGLVVAPFALFPPRQRADPRWKRAHGVLEGLKASVATGKEQQIRLGFGWVFTVMKKFDYREMISRQKACDKSFIGDIPTTRTPINSPLVRRERETLAAAKDVFVEACMIHVQDFASAPDEVRKKNEGLIEAAQVACADSEEIDGGWLPQVAAAVSEVYKGWLTAPNAAKWSSKNTEKLQWQPPDPYRDTTETAIVAEYQRHLWDTPQFRFSVEGNLDFAAIRWGFSPTTAEGGMAVQKSLSRGELEASQVKGAVYLRYKRVEGLLGFGGGRMIDLEMKARTFLLLSAQLGVVVASLNPRTPLLDDNGRLRTTESGEMPPRLVLGVEGSLRPMLGASAADAETSVYPQAHIEAVRLGIFADFRVQKNLSFRLGFPVEGKMVLQKKDDATGIDQDVGMQWSIPVFITTIVAM